MTHNLKAACTGVLVTLSSAAVLGVAVLSSAAKAQDSTTMSAGVLTCVVEGGVGLLVFSSKDMECEFASVTGRKDYYIGNVQKYGLDIGVTGNSFVKWVVLAPTGQPEKGGLAGTYVGVSGEATVGGGVGANGLVGGLDRSFTLQPFSAQLQTGVNLALGIGSMTLESAE